MQVWQTCIFKSAEESSKGRPTLLREYKGHGWMDGVLDPRWIVTPGRGRRLLDNKNGR